MKRILVGMAAAGLSGLAPAVLAGTASAQGLPGDDLGPGSAVMWATFYNGTSDQFFEYALAEGDGYMLYRSGQPYEVYGADSYFMLAQGILYASCDGDLPSAETIAELGTLWPLEEGKSVSVDYTGAPAVISVGEATSYFLMGKSLPAHLVTVDYTNNEDGLEDENLVILDNAPLTARINWTDGTVDRVMTVGAAKPGYAVPQADLDMMGECAAMLVSE